MHGRLVELLTRRRLGGAALVLAGLAVAAVVLWPALRGGDEGAGAREPPARLVSVPELGYAFAHPRDWSRTVQGRVIRLRSPDGSAIMTFSAPVAGRAPQRVKSSVKRALTSRLEGARIVRDGRGRLGERTVESLEVTGLASGARIRALALIEDTPHRTYAITLLTPRRPSRKRLAEVAEILESVELRKPVRVKR